MNGLIHCKRIGDDKATKEIRRPYIVLAKQTFEKEMRLLSRKRSSIALKNIHLEYTIIWLCNVDENRRI